VLCPEKKYVFILSSFFFHFMCHRLKIEKEKFIKMIFATTKVFILKYSFFVLFNPPTQKTDFYLYVYSFLV